MQPLRFEVSPAVVALFPAVTIGVVRGAIAGPRPGGDDALRALREEAVAAFGERGLDAAKLLELPHFAAWRAAYQAFGVKAKSHKPTHEALARRVLKGDGLPRIHPIVDTYLTNQLAHLLPHGGYDAGALEGALRLDVSEGGEPFEPLGGGDDPTRPGELVYRDDARVLTRRWNYRDCDATKIHEGTTEFLLMLESPSDAVDPSLVEVATADLATRYERCFEGAFDARTLRVSAETREFEL